MILQRLQIDGVNFSFRALAHTLIETLPALLAQPPPLHHGSHEFRRAIPLARRIAGRQVVQIAQHVHPNIEPDDVHQPEAGAPRQADQRAGERVHFFYRVIALGREFVDRGAEETADAVGDEIGGVFARDYALAEVQIAEVRHPVGYFGSGAGPANHLHQVQVARRIEKVRAQKVAAQFFVEAGGDAGQGNAAGIGGKNGLGPAHRGNALDQAALNVQIFGHGLNNPVAVAQTVEVVLEVARSDQLGGRLGEERHRTLPGSRLEARQGSGIPLGLTGNHDVQQVHREPGVGKMGGDTRPHGSRAQDSDTTKWSHQL